MLSNCHVCYKAEVTSGSREWSSAGRCGSLASPCWDKNPQIDATMGLLIGTDAPKILQLMEVQGSCHSSPYTTLCYLDG